MIRARLAAVFAACLLLAGPVVAKDDLPPQIKAIGEKIKHGQAPTDAEMKAYMDWANKAAGGGGSSSGGSSGGSGFSSTQSDMNDDVEDAGSDGSTLCKKGGHAIGLTARPSKDAYVAMAADAVRVYGAKLPDGGSAQINAVLQHASNPVWGGDISLMLVAHGSGSAAVVAAASSAQRAPTDANTANNLGVVLRGMKDYGRAAVALTYARTLVPDSPLIASNLGWLAMSQHDQTSAGHLFNAALSKKKDLAVSLAGDGLISQCGGKHAEALKFLHASMAAGYSKLAQVGIESAEQDLQKDNAGADIGSPDMYGKPDTNMPYFPDPPMPGDAKTLAQWAKAGENGAIRKWTKGWEDVVERAEQTSVTQGKNAKLLPEKSGNDQHIVFTRGYPKELFEISDTWRMLSREEHGTEFATESVAFEKRDNCVSCGDGGYGGNGEACSVTRPRVIGLQPQYRAMMQSYWTSTRKYMSDVYAYTQPLLGQIHDPAGAAAEKASLEETYATPAAVFGGTIGLWQAEVSVAYELGDLCGDLPPVVIKPGVLKPYPLDPNACKSGETHMNFGIINFNADCEKMALDFGEGVVGSGEYKFGKDWGSDQLTIFAGAGVSAGLGPLSAGAKTGSYVTFQGGQVVDYGNKSSASVGAGFGPVSASAEASVRISGVSGLDTNLDSGVTVGGPGLPE